MSSLWTPGGEHKVPRPGDAAPAGPPGSGGGAPGGGAPGGGPGRGPEEPEDEELSEQELREVARQLASAPVEDVIANHCYGLFELAALHLSQQPPQLPQARLAIDALGALVDGLGDRLGQHAPGLREGLAQLRIAFVRISDAAGAANGAGGSTADWDEPQPAEAGGNPPAADPPGAEPPGAEPPEPGPETASSGS